MSDDLLREIPMGFGMALAQNARAMEVFSAMSDPDKQLFIQGSHRVRSKQEMQAYVDKLGSWPG
jgi:hypothetical protein